MTRLRHTTRIISIILLLGLGLGYAVRLLLPGFIETRILPRLAREAGLPLLVCRINHLGFTKTSAGPLTLGAGIDPAVTVERISLLYNPTSIQKGELEKVVLSGVSIKTVFSKGTLSIPGLDEALDKNSRDKNTGNETDKRSTSASRLPVPPFTELLIERSVIIAKAGGSEYRIPFSLQLKKTASLKPETFNLHGTLEIRPRSSPVTLQFTTNLDEKTKVHLNLQADKVDLLNFADILQMLLGLELKGQIGLSAEADLALTPLSLENLNAKIVWHNGHLSYNDFRIRAARNPDPREPKRPSPDSQKPKPEKEACVLTLQKNDPPDPWQLKINQLYLDAPFTPTLSNIELSIRTAAENISLQGQWETRLTELRHGLFTLINPFQKKWNFTAKLKPQGAWQAVLKSPADNTAWEIQQGDLTISGRSPAVSINASGANRKSSLTHRSLLLCCRTTDDVNIRKHLDNSSRSCLGRLVNC